MTDNPLMDSWTTPFGVPPFDRIKPEHVVPALEEGMRQHQADIAAIGADPAPPDFENTILPMQRAGRLLSQTCMVFQNLVMSLGGDELRAIDLQMSPVLAQHWTRMALDPALFARVAVLHAQLGTLDLAEDQRRLLERTHLGFIRSGAALDPAAKARLTEISEQLAVLHTRFGQAVLHDETAWVLPLAETDLEGLPHSIRAGARQAAEERGLQGYAVTLSRSLIEPFLTFSDRRDLRQVAYEAWSARGSHPGPHDTRVLIPQILALRRERAVLLGYAGFAEYRMADTMARTPEAAEALLLEVWRPALRKAAAERDRLLARARTEGFNGALAPWDWRYYAEKVRRADYAVDEEALKAYLPFESIQRAAFDTAGRLFGLRFTPRPDIGLYHPDVRAYAVSDESGHVGVFLADPYARAGKRSGAWMSSYRDQEAMDEPVSAVIVNNNNFAKASPTLLSFDDAETLFHEFGHALHGLLSRVRYPGQSGTTVRRDFVEFPSQVFEHWLSLPETLRHYARHHETGEAMPEAMITRLLASRGFNRGFGTVEYAGSALIDLALHRDSSPETMDVDAFEQAFRAREGVPPEIGLRHRPAHFLHLFDGGGYAAGYYAYLWAEVLDADGFEAFTEAGDPFDPAIARRLHHVLAAGDTEDPMQLYIGFRGRAPSTAALLRHRDLLTA